VLQFLPVEYVYYDRALLSVRPWVFVSGHFAHLNLMHMMLNLFALVLLMVLLGERVKPLEWAALFTLQPLLISGLLWWSGIDWYCGLSALLHGSYVYLALRQPRAVALILLVVVVVKMLLETSGVLQNELLAGEPILHSSHVYGAVVGLVMGCTSRTVFWRLGVRERSG
jgi:rhomboid family GlyGly-CTERM serine protease